MREKANTSLGGVELRYPPITRDLTAILERIARFNAIGFEGTINPLSLKEMADLAKKIETELKCKSEIEERPTTEDNYNWSCLTRFKTSKVEVAILIPYITLSRKEGWHLERSVAVCGEGYLRDGPQDQGVIYETRDQIFEKFKRGLLELEQRISKSQETVFVRHI